MNYTFAKTYPKSQLEESEMTATMFLFGEIGDGRENPQGLRTIDGNAFASEIRNLSELGFNLTIDINSNGGMIQPGFAIFDAIRVAKADTRIVGVAASMAGAISQAGRRRMMNDIGSLMVHGISGTGTDKQFFEILKAQLIGILTDRSKLTEKRIEEIMDSERNEWFAVVKGVPKNRHALQVGLIDEVIETGFNMEKDLLEVPENGDTLVTYYNSILAPEPEEKPKSMDKYLQVKAALGLDPEASEDAVLKALNKIKAEAALVPGFKTQVEKLKNENQSFKEGQIDEVVNAGKEAGYPEDQLDNLKAYATADLDGARNLVESLKGVANVNGDNNGGGNGAGGSAQPVSLAVDNAAQNNAANNNGGNGGGGDEPELKTYDEYMKTAEGETEFYNLSTEDQEKVFAAHDAEHGIKRD